MTALAKYERLECSGLWRASASAQLREVVVGLREATLLLQDPRTGMALTHWSLPAIERVNGTAMPALFTAGRLEDGSPAETLELDDPDMIAALETIHVTLVRRQPHPGRLRGVTIVSVLTLVGLLAVLWLPGAMIRHTAVVMPAATRVQIGKMALADLVRLSGSPCTATLGKRAAATLALRLSAAGVGEIVVVRDGVAGTVSLPGGLVVLGLPLLQSTEDPEVLAGHVLAEATRAAQEDPVLPLLHHAGLTGTLRLLATGRLAEEAVANYAEALLQAPAVEPDEARLLERFRLVNLASSTYAQALEAKGEGGAGLIAADPFKGKSPVQVLEDNDWVSLQGICDL
jgi:hypothetical protein